MVKKNVIVLIISLFCLSCGIEDIPYLDYIPDGIINDTISARILLPSSSAEGYSAYFQRFEIYYRIYISDRSLSVPINTSLMSQINNFLYSDFQGLYSLTNKTSTSANPSNLETVFSNRRYFKLTLQDDNIDNVLDRSSLGGTLDIQFPPNPGVNPVLILNDGDSHTLQRATSGPSLNFSPVPDRNFLNHPALYNNDNVTDQENADVAKNTQNTPRYTYVSMYIFAIGRDYITTIYSQPTHIGIFLLAED